MPASSNDSLLYGLRRYAIKKKIGSGGMATVFLAHDQALDRDVAIKLMHEHLMQSPESVKRFTTEARAVASLSHENIIKIFDFGEIESRPFLVMEYVDGLTLASLIEKHGALPNLAAIEAARQIALGLSCAHANGIVHRDIKPDNIIIDRTGCVRVMDFGIAHIVNNESLTVTGAFVGSPRFISPEQAEGKGALSGKTDIFSLGVLLYLSLSGKLPFDADTPVGAIHAILHSTPHSLLKRNAHVLFWISDAVNVFLSKDPASRPDARSVIACIERECGLHGLVLGKERLKAFIDDPETYPSHERLELFEHFRAFALREAKKKKVASTLKMMEQAKVFGAIAAADRKIIDACMRRRFLRKLAVCCGITLLACCMVAGAIRMFAEYKASHALREPSNLAPVTQKSMAMNIGSASAIPVADSNTQKSTPGGITPPVPAIMMSPNQNRVIKKELGIDFIAKQAMPGFLSIKTNPPWVKIFIDDIERGVTPAKILYQTSQGSHEVRIVKEGFAEYRNTIIISGTDTISLKIQLHPNPPSN